MPSAHVGSTGVTVVVLRAAAVVVVMLVVTLFHMHPV